MKEVIHVKSISQAHEIFSLNKPKHPLVSIYQHKDIDTNAIPVGIKYSFELYHIIFKSGYSGTLQYGRNSYDFQDGTIILTSPGQVVTSGGWHNTVEAKGWSLLFHPDLIRKSELGKHINSYSFFSYDVHEALHVSEDEEQNITELAKKIEKEYTQNIDRHSQNLIISNIQLMLDYCIRYYDRQFYTRTNLNKDLVSQFEQLLSEYFDSDKVLEIGIPTVKSCGLQLNMSPNYLSDLLKKETGKNAQEHIHYFLIEKAKNKLLGTTESVSQIAFSLGFEYPQHFSKIFKTKTGMSPIEYRNKN
ncbi:MAG: AraC family transcriptional regulator [Thalassobius sp.]|nr:AraC family transcriptional regulator [Thalassovita sp.]